jgi:hypothetical protein
MTYSTLVTEPTNTVSVSSAYDEQLEVTYDLTFQGGEYTCINAAATGALGSISASLIYSSTDPAQTSVDFVTVIKYTNEAKGECIQIGKFNYIGGNGERCSHYYDWPDNWNTGATNGETYTATVDVSSAGFNYDLGDYTLCFGDGNLASAYDTYVGTISYATLITEPINVVEVTSSYDETLSVHFDVTFEGGDYTCITSHATGSLNTIDTSLVFTT